MAGRVYGLPGDFGVRDGSGCSVYTAGGVKIPGVTRVEFDRDADDGMAAVTAYFAVSAADGKPHFLVDYDKNEACLVTFRTWVRIVHKGQPSPAENPDTFLWRQPDGSLKLDADPVPDVPFTVGVASV